MSMHSLVDYLPWIFIFLGLTGIVLLALAD